jgi:uncharacterized protein (TIGR03437 family)
LGSFLAWITMSACAATQTSSPAAWINTGQWSATVTQGPLGGPLAVDSSGDLLVANSLVGFSAPTKILGGVSAASNWVSKVGASGVPVFAVQIGGIYDAYQIAADSTGNVLIAGAGPAAGGLPVTPNAYNPSPSGDNSAFVCKLSGVNGSPIFCTYLNFNKTGIVGIAADAQGDVYILVGGLNTPTVTTRGALSIGGQDVVLLKLDPSGQNLLYAAAFGGDGTDSPAALSVDANGNAYVIGSTTSTDFPGAADGAIPTPSGSFVAKVDPTGSKLLYASYGRANEFPATLSVDPSGAAYVTGTVAQGGLYVRKYSADGTAVAYENFLPGTAGSQVRGSAVDTAGILSTIGSAGSIAFPQLSSVAACQPLDAPSLGSSVGSYLIRLAADGSVLQSTFFPSDFPSESFQPAGGGSVISIQQGGGWVAGSPFNSDGPTGAGVIQLGPDLTAISPVNVGCLANGASFLPGSITAGEIVSIFGSGLGPAAPAIRTLDSNGGIASALDGVQVTFDGTPAPLLYIQDAQINAITPWELTGKTTTEMCVVYNGNQACVTPSVVASAPGLFVTALGDAAALNQDGTLNSSANPAPVGSIVSLYATGLGAISPAPADGAIVQLPLPTLVNPVQVNFTAADPQNTNSIPAEVLYAGPAPFQVAGLYQMNVRIPSGSAGLFYIPGNYFSSGGAGAKVFVTPVPPSTSEP